MFTDFFYLLRERGIKVTTGEWFSLLEALDKGLAGSSLLEFYYLSRAVLVKSEAQFDKFDRVFAEYFKGVEPHDDIPEEVMEWLSHAKEAGLFDKDEVDARTTFGLQKLQEMMRERLLEQTSEHNGGKYWIGTAGTSTMGNSGYAATGVRVGGEGQHKHALQVVGERHYRDYREDETLDIRQFQMAFRRLRQYTSRLDGPKSQLDLDGTVAATCNNAGKLKLVFERPRTNSVKLILLFDSGGSMEPFSKMCSRLFQAASKANHFKDLKIYYFHNCFYDTLFTTPACDERESVQTQWVLDNLDSSYKVAIVGDASMAESELLERGGSLFFFHYNQEPGIEWIRRFTRHYRRVIWLNPIPDWRWETTYGRRSIAVIREEMPMFHMSVQGLGDGFKKLIGTDY